MTIQSNNNNLNYLIDRIFTKVSRLFVLLFATNDKGDRKLMKKVSLTYQQKMKKKLKRKINEMSGNNDYTTGNLSDFAYFKGNYRLIAIDLSKQTNLKDPQQINFISSIEGQNNGATIFLIIEKSKETTFQFLQNSVNIL